MRPLVVIVGPTASGKSALAMQVARQFGGEIICADSRTVYKGMDIGTAKPTLADRAAVRHHLLDVVEPCEYFSAANFKQRSVAAIEEISDRGMLPVMVGGSGLYVDSVIFDYSFGQQADQTLRMKLQAMTVSQLQALCLELHIPLPENQHNPRHLMRAIELGGLMQETRNLRDNTLVVGIATDRSVLKSRIAARARAMVDNGIIDEVERLGERYGWECEAMTGSIYRVFRGVVESTTSLETALEEFIKSDMRLAKRQMTWFRRNPFIYWSESGEELITKIAQFVSEQNKLR